MEKGERGYVYQEGSVHPELQAILDAVFSMVGPEEVEGKEEKVEAIFWYNYPQITSELLAKFPNLKVIGVSSVGYDQINLEACRSRGVRVSNTPGVLSGTVADIAFSLLLAAARRVLEGDAIAKHPDTTRYEQNWFGCQVSGATLGVVGMGRIGTEVAKRARGFDMTVIYHNRHRRPREEEEQVGASYVDSLHDLLQQSDFVVVAVPGLRENFRLFGRAEFSAMKRTGVFVNVGRGSVVDHAALVEALRDGRIASAGLDVTDPEPLPRDHPLLSMSNVTITPHVGEWGTQNIWTITSFFATFIIPQ